MTDTSKRSRVQAGVPTGGEFATEPRPENGELETASQAQQREFIDRLEGVYAAARNERGELNDREYRLRDRESILHMASSSAQARYRYPEAKYIDFDLGTSNRIDADMVVRMTRVTDADGNVLDGPGTVKTGPFFGVISEFSGWSVARDGKNKRIDIDKAIEAGAKEAARAEEEAARAESLKRPSLSRMRSEMAVLDACNKQQRVEFTDDGGATIIKGVMRHWAYTEDFQIAPHTTDPRDAYVHITTSTGGERLMLFSRLADLHANEDLSFDERP